MLADRDESQETANRTKRFLSGREKYTRPITRHAARHASALATRTSMSLSTAHGLGSHRLGTIFGETASNWYSARPSSSS